MKDLIITVFIYSILMLILRRKIDDSKYIKVFFKQAISISISFMVLGWLMYETTIGIAFGLVFGIVLATLVSLIFWQIIKRSNIERK